MSEKADALAAVREAFDGAGDLIKAATLYKPEGSAYSPALGQPATAGPATATGRCLFDRRGLTIAAQVYKLAVEPGNESVYLEGFQAMAPTQGCSVEVDGVKRRVIFCEDIMKGGFLWLAVLA